SSLSLIAEPIFHCTYLFRNRCRKQNLNHLGLRHASRTRGRAEPFGCSRRAPLIDSELDLAVSIRNGRARQAKTRVGCSYISCASALVVKSENLLGDARTGTRKTGKRRAVTINERLVVRRQIARVVTADDPRPDAGSGPIFHLFRPLGLVQISNVIGIGL